MDQICERGNKKRHTSEDCKDVVGEPPLIMNKFFGLRFCGKLAPYTFRSMSRPILDESTPVAETGKRRYVCPPGRVACEESWLDPSEDAEEAHEFVVCIL